jgi:hypothetical protein
MLVITFFRGTGENKRTVSTESQIADLMQAPSICDSGILLQSYNVLWNGQ